VPPAVRRLLSRLTGTLPLTWAGAALLAAAVVALVPFGLWRQDLVLLVVGATALALLAATLLAVLLGTLAVRRRLRRRPAAAPLALEVGRPGDTGFILVRPWWVPWLDLDHRVAEPIVAVDYTARGRRREETWTPLRRGTPDRVVRHVTVRDVFGLCALRFELRERRDMTFSPALGALAQIAVVHGLAGGDQLPHPDGRPEGDLADMRAYGAGDPIRFVLWKVFARTRQLVVRTPERALAPTRRTVAYLVTSPHDEAAAAGARIATTTGALGEDWVFGVDGTRQTASDAAGAAALILRSASHPPDGGADGLATFLASQESFAAHRAIVFAPGRPGPWQARVRAASATTRLEIVVCIDGVRPDPKGGLIGRALLRPRPAPSTGVRPTRSELAALCADLGAAGQVRVLDRAAGQLYGAQHLAALQRGAA